MRVRARDDRGKPIRVRVWLVAPDDRGDGTRPWIVRQWRRLPEVIIPPAIFVCGILVLVTLALREGPAVIAVTLFSPVSSSLIFVSIALLLWMNRAMARHVKKTREAWKGAKRCPACRYDMRGLEPDEDDCTPCPECGAAWDMREKRGMAKVVLRADGSTAASVSR
ncbi:MAG TPA: hypothetical protein VK157_03795 [Phycisphaerales bacterium]|nr:hypothetical protein [Phycisphaerales bacterium]